MAFNPDEYLKKAAPAAGGFDPDAYLSAPDAKAPNAGRVAETALESYGNTLAFGNLSQLQAGAAKLLPDPGADVDAKLKAQGFDIQGPDSSYTAQRDAFTKRREALEAENPKAAIAGKVAGVLNAAPLLTGAPAASFAGRAAQAAKAGGIAGALTNPGDVEGQVADPLEELTARGKGAAKGAATSVVAQGVLEKVASPLASLIGKKLSGGAEKMAVKALNPTKAQLEKLKVSGKEDDLGRMLLDEGAIPKVGSTNAILGRVSQKKDEIGEKIGEILEKSGDQKLISGKVIAKNLAQADEFTQVAAGVPGAESLAKRAEGMLNTIRSRGQMTVREAHTLRKQVDKLINFSKRNDDLRGIEPQLHAIRTEINGAIQSVMNRFPGKQGEQLKRLNAAYSNLASAERIAEGGVARQAANQSFSLGDKVAATIGGMSGGLSGAALVGGANKLARTYGRSAAARRMDAAGKVAKGVAGGVQDVAESPAVRAMIARAAEPKTASPEKPAGAPLQDPQIIGIFRQNPALVEEIQDPKVREQIRSLLNRAPSGQ